MTTKSAGDVKVSGFFCIFAKTSVMLDKDKVILAVYVGVQSMSDASKVEYLKKVTEMIKSSFDESVITLVFPDVLSIGYHVDCVNPKYLSDEEYERLSKAAEKIILKAEEAE